MKKWILLLLSFFSICTISLTAGCGGPKLEGKWITQAQDNWNGRPICLIMDIQKVKGSDTEYSLSMQIKSYRGNRNRFIWTKEKQEQPLLMTYDKEKQMLIPKEAKMEGFDFTYKDGKWVMAATWILGGPYTLEEYSDSALDTIKKNCQEIIKKQWGEDVKFFDPKKK